MPTARPPEPRTSIRPAVAKFIADEYSFWAPLAKEAGMTVR